MSRETFGTELTVTPRTCPIADADTLFRQVAEQLPDDDVVRTLRDGLPDTLLLSIPGAGVSVATCLVSASVPNSTIESVRIEIRPATESIDSLVDLTMTPGSVAMRKGQPHRGGAFYQYCGTRPDNVRKVCASGWRNSDLDIALTFNGVEADLVDLAAAERVLAMILEDVVHYMST